MTKSKILAFAFMAITLFWLIMDINELHFGALIYLGLYITLPLIFGLSVLASSIFSRISPLMDRLSSGMVASGIQFFVLIVILPAPIRGETMEVSIDKDYSGSIFMVMAGQERTDLSTDQYGVIYVPSGMGDKYSVNYFIGNQDVSERVENVLHLEFFRIDMDSAESNALIFASFKVDRHPQTGKLQFTENASAVEEMRVLIRMNRIDASKLIMVPYQKHLERMFYPDRVQYPK
ncbi:MAG: hypothetical protein WEC59_03505 [Salibacteraceae bacterium]